MPTNLFVSCELNRPEKGYDRLVSAIKSLGDAWSEVHFGLWSLKTSQSAVQVRDRLKPALEHDDKLVIIDAAGGKVAWLNLDAKAAQGLHDLGF